MDLLLSVQKPEGILVQLVHQLLRIAWMLTHEIFHHLCRLTAAMAAEQRTEPITGEEYVARALHVDQSIKSGSDVPVVERFPRAVVEQGEERCCPGFRLTILCLRTDWNSACCLSVSGVQARLTKSNCLNSSTFESLLRCSANISSHFWGIIIARR